MKSGSALIGLTALLLLAACRHRSDDDSLVKHEIGSGARKGASMGPGDCKAPSSFISITPVPEYAAADAYLTKLARVLMDANPRIFRDAFAPENFCFYVIRDDELNASATPPTANIKFHDSLLANMRSDAEVASTLAHEIAHLTRSHVDSLHPKLANDPVYSEMREKGSKFSSPTTEKMQALDIEFYNLIRDQSEEVQSDIQYKRELVSYQDAQNSKMNTDASEKDLADAHVSLRMTLNQIESAALRQKILRAIMISAPLSSKVEMEKLAAGIDLEKEARRVLGEDYASISYSWSEQEADEVGYEFFLRAKFDDETFRTQQWSLAGSTEKDNDVCQKLIFQLRSWGEAKIERGLGDHPSDCWRRFNISYLESAQHIKEYSLLRPLARTKTVFPGELEKIKGILKVHAKI